MAIAVGFYMRILRSLFFLMARFLLGLRYRVQYHGAEQLQGLTGPTLILPNHPGYTDPMLLLAGLWPSLHPRPLVAEDTFKNPFFFPFMKLINAVAVPDVTRVDAEARANAAAAVQEVIARLR